MTSPSELKRQHNHLELSRALPDYALDTDAQTYPFRYSDDERPDLINGLARQYPSDDLGPWVAPFAIVGSTTTMTLLHSVTRGIRTSSRMCAGRRVSGPGETLRLEVAAAGTSRY